MPEIGGTSCWRSFDAEEKLLPEGKTQQSYTFMKNNYKRNVFQVYLNQLIYLAPRIRLIRNFSLRAKYCFAITTEKLKPKKGEYELATIIRPDLTCSMS